MSGLQTTRGTRRGPPAAVPEARPVSSLCCHGAPCPRPGGLGGAEARRPPRDFGEGHRPRRGWRPPSVHAHGLSRKLDELTHGLRPHTHVHTHTRRAHTHTSTQISTHTHACAHSCTRTHVHMHTRTNTQTRACAHTFAHTSARTEPRGSLAAPPAPARTPPAWGPRGRPGPCSPRPRFGAVLPDAPAMAATRRRQSRSRGTSAAQHAGHGCNAQLGDPHFTSRDTVPSLETWPLRQAHRGGGGLGRRPPRARAGPGPSGAS